MSNQLPTLELLEHWFDTGEDEHLEFKEARTQIDSDKLTRYCVAMANERGGHIVLGVTDKRPRRVVGTQVGRDLSSLKRDLSQRIRLNIDATAIEHPDGRVVVVTVPSRPIGTPMEYKGAYWMRRGEELVAMPPEVLQRIFAEAQPDFSAEICAAARLSDLDEAAIERLRALWLASSGNQALAGLSAPQLLEDAELTVDGQVTYAALIMLGSRKGLGRHLAQAEIIFEYRSTASSVAYQQREEYRQGFLLYIDELWQRINLRNEVHFFQEGLFRREVSMFNEATVREALLNALAHRDYRLGGSTFVRQYPKRLEIVSPGGFPPGITPENLLWKQSPRNRRVAEVMAKCDLVERSGQGADLMFSTCIRESKPLPDYVASDAYEVHLVLSGEVQDERFLRYLERVGAETLAHFSSDDFLLLDAIHREITIPERIRERVPELLRLGVIESKGRGRGARYLLAERFYQLSNQRGAYTRKKGLDTEHNKALLLEHIKRNAAEGSPGRDLREVLPALLDRQVQHLLTLLKNEGLIHRVGETSASLWFPGELEDNP